MRTLLITLLLSSVCLAKPNPYLNAYELGRADGMIKGISVSYKTFRQMYKDKKHRQEYLRRLVATIQEQKEFERNLTRGGK